MCGVVKRKHEFIMFIYYFAQATIPTKGKLN